MNTREESPCCESLTGNHPRLMNKYVSLKWLIKISSTTSVSIKITRKRPWSEEQACVREGKTEGTTGRHAVLGRGGVV